MISFITHENHTLIIMELTVTCMCHMHAENHLAFAHLQLISTKTNKNGNAFENENVLLTQYMTLYTSVCGTHYAYFAQQQTHN